MERIILVDPIDPHTLAKLREDFIVDDHSNLSKEELVAVVPGYEALIGRTSTKLDAALINAATSLKVIGVHATGWDHIDLGAASARGICVLGFPQDKEAFAEDTLRGSFIPVAEHVLMGMLMVAKRAPESTTSMKERRWDKFRLMGTELYGKTLGIVGLGRIGSLVAARARAFGMNIIATHPSLSPDEATARGATLVPMDTLLTQSDFISIHVPKRETTLGLIDSGAFSKMRDGVVVINTSRAGIVDEAALLAALQSGKAKGAVIDVFDHPPEGVNWELAMHPQVVATPHIAGVTEESLARVSAYIAESVTDYLKNGKIRGRINS